MKTNTNYVSHPFGVPTTFTPKNYIAMIGRFRIGQLFLNTTLYCIGAWAIAMITSIPAAFAVAKLTFPLRRLLFAWVVVTLAVPVIGYVIPLYTLLAQFGLVDTAWGIMLVWAAGAVPGDIFLMSAVMRGLPTELLEAGKVDGAGYFQSMFSLVLPLSVPAIVTITIFNLTGWWNELLVPLIFLPSGDKATVTLGVSQLLSKYESDTPLFMTGLLFAALPVTIVYLIFQRYIRSGLVMGSVK